MGPAGAICERQHLPLGSDLSRRQIWRSQANTKTNITNQIWETADPADNFRCGKKGHGLAQHHWNAAVLVNWSCPELSSFLDCNTRRACSAFFAEK